MEIIKIDDDTIQILISSDEQKMFGVYSENVRKSDVHTRKMCEKILAAATKERLFKQTSNTLSVKAKQTERGLTLWIGNAPKKENMEYFYQTVRFDSINDLYDVLPFFDKKETDPIYSSLYIYEGKYYLYFEIFSSQKDANRLLRNILEYGYCTPCDRSVLTEHGKTLIKDDALERMLHL